jgi:hypothetical protein
LLFIIIGGVLLEIRRHAVRDPIPSGWPTHTKRANPALMPRIHGDRLKRLRLGNVLAIEHHFIETAAQHIRRGGRQGVNRQRKKRYSRQGRGILQM